MAQQQAATVIPNLYVDSVDEVRTFYLERLGFEHMMGVVGKDGGLDFCMVTRGGAMVMLARPTEKMEGTSRSFPTKRPLELYISVEDVDRYHDEVKKRGVSISQPLATQWWGDRNFAVSDPYGYLVWFYQTVSEPKPPAGVKMV
jgi:uncharacterized glyoxalase superfamily protein PhnB